MSSTDDETKIIKIADYTLKYDEKTEGLRDKTFSELIKEYGPKIRCPCMNREYQISSQFVNSHFNCQKHKNWIIKSQKEHIETYGHCSSPQDIVNSQYKELRNIKCNVNDLTNKNKALSLEKIKLEELNKSLQDENKELKSKITYYQEEYENKDEEEEFVECS